MISTLTGKNQVTVPAELARELSLEPGTRLDWTAGATPDTIHIRILPSKRQVLDRVQELGTRIKNRNLIDELIEERASEE
jgi:bifunctional DNA-binding transcriptional regulator/antitoxin component of YhaV-PrlF toxin-antitoxin module